MIFVFFQARPISTTADTLSIMSSSLSTPATPICFFPAASSSESTLKPSLYQLHAIVREVSYFSLIFKDFTFSISY